VVLLMTGYLLFELATCALSLTLGTIVSTRAFGLQVNRSIGLILLCGAYWSFCELMWNSQSDASAALTWMRLSALGWMWIGPLFFRIFVELLGARAGSMKQLVPWLYGSAGLGILLYVATPWGLARAIPTSWGWGYEFGPLFPFTHAPTIVPLAIGLLSWKRVRAVFGSRSERRHSQNLHLATTAAAALGVSTDFVLPALGVHVPGLSSFAIAAIGVLLLFNLQRYGYLLLSPAAFAHEILETLEDGVALLRPDGRVVSANRSFERMASAGEGGLRDRRSTDLLPDLRRRGGNEIFSHTTNLLVGKDESLPTSVTSLALHDARGSMVGEALIVRDLREIAELRRRLVTAGRLAAVGELSTVISSEINTPVELVLQKLAALRFEWDRATSGVHGAELVALEKTISEGEELIDECIEGVERVAAVVSEVRSFSRLEGGSREIVSVGDLLETALRRAAPRAGPEVLIARQLASAAAISCVPLQLERVVLNLLLNAIHAVEGVGRVRVTSEDAAGCVRICVEDDGCGISASERERIFDPFFTTRPIGEGTGLGLSISYHIVRSHGGDIRVESQPGHTCFSIELPVASG
jgi:signal transduction histidine kinase